MSYILEALRKSERERTLGRVPSLDTVHERARPASPLPWVLALISVLLLSAVAAVWLLRDSGPGNAGTAHAPTSETGKEARPPPAPDAAPRGGDNQVADATLPPALSQQLPALAVNALSYSDEPGKRFIMINQRILREGERLGADITVQEIMPDSARLEFRGHQFLVRP